MRKIIWLIGLLISSQFISASSLLVEAESFQQKGGWVVDQQFMDIMGSPYLMAHGMGIKVEDASTIMYMYAPIIGHLLGRMERDQENSH